MKCTLKNTCGRRDYCCSYCTIKCPVRCNDDHTNCPWFVNEPIEDETLIDHKAATQCPKNAGK